MTVVLGGIRLKQHLPCGLGYIQKVVFGPDVKGMPSPTGLLATPGAAPQTTWRGEVVLQDCRWTAPVICHLSLWLEQDGNWAFADCPGAVQVEEVHSPRLPSEAAWQKEWRWQKLRTDASGRPLVWWKLPGGRSLNWYWSLMGQEEPEWGSLSLESLLALHIFVPSKLCLKKGGSRRANIFVCQKSILE